MSKRRRFQLVDIAGLVIAALFVVGGILALVHPQEMVIFHATNDMIGSPEGLLERTTPATIRFYAIGALVVGAALLFFVLWPSARDDK